MPPTRLIDDSSNIAESHIYLPQNPSSAADPHFSCKLLNRYFQIVALGTVRCRWRFQLTAPSQRPKTV